MRAILLVLTLLTWTAFGFSLWREPRRLRTGVYLFLALVITLAAGVVAKWEPVRAVAGAVAALVIVLMPLITVGVALFLIGNGVVMARRERPSAANLLGAAVGLATIFGMVLVAVMVLGNRPVIVAATGVTLMMIGGYLAAVFACFCLYCLLYALRRRSRPVVGVIVLGSRIVDGRVPPLLAARLERAMQVHRLHTEQGWAPPLLVPSGGQGADESESEGSAMARWLLEHGAPENDVVAETEAETTAQNLRFGREVIRENRGEGRIAVVTNDYHAFRAALLSHRIGLGADVLGARTASYFRPSAYLREFVAVLRMHLRWHLVVVLVLVAGCVALTVEALQGL